MKLILILCGAVLVGFAIWVRVAPFDATRWHVDPVAALDPGQAGHRASYTSELSPNDVLEQLSAVALATPRTRLLVGSPEEGRMSFITRSRLWGFPDVTTISARPEAQGSEVTLFARQRFGGGDMGVNAARVTDWIARAQAGQGLG